MTTLVPHAHAYVALRLSAGTRGQAGRSGLLPARPAVRRHRRIALRASVASLDADPTQTARGVSQLLATLGDAAGVSPGTPEVDAAVKAAEQLANNKSGFLGGIANLLEGLLEGIDSVLSAAHVPYSYGFSIIVLTLLVKAATFPLSKKQIESTSAMQALQPRVKELQVRRGSLAVEPARAGTCRRGLKASRPVPSDAALRCRRPAGQVRERPGEAAAGDGADVPAGGRQPAGWLPPDTRHSAGAH